MDAGQDSCTRGQSLGTWGPHEYYAGCQQSPTKHGECTGAILAAAIYFNDMEKPGHEEGADNADDVKQVIKTLERECRVSQDITKNTLDKNAHYWTTRRVW